MKPIIFSNSGKLTLVQYAADGSLTIDSTKTNKAVGTFQSITPSINVKTTELPDGNSDWPMGEYDTGRSGQVQVEMSSFQPSLAAVLLGTTATDSTSEDFWAVEEEKSVPASGTYVVILDHAVKAATVPIIADNSGSPFASTASGPAAGQFTVSGASITFNSVDAGKEVVATYMWTGTQATTFGLAGSGSRPQLYAIMSGLATDEDEINTYDVNLIIDKCKATGDLNPPKMQREPQPWSLTLKVLKPRAGNKAVNFKFNKR